MDLLQHVACQAFHKIPRKASIPILQHRKEKHRLVKRLLHRHIQCSSQGLNQGVRSMILHGVHDFTKEQLWRQRPWPNSIQHKVKRWRLTELFMLSSSLPNIHPLDKGLPSLSLHALLALLDINTLMPASSQSTLSLKKDELRARTDPFARFTDKTYCPHPRSNVCAFHLRKTLVWPRLPEVWNDFHLHRGNLPLIIFQQWRILKFNSHFLPLLKTVLCYFYILKTDF